MVPLVPTTMASLGSRKLEEQVKTANRFPENFRLTTTVSSTPVTADTKHCLIASVKTSSDWSLQLCPILKAENNF